MKWLDIFGLKMRERTKRHSLLNIVVFENHQNRSTPPHPLYLHPHNTNPRLHHSHFLPLLQIITHLYICVSICRKLRSHIFIKLFVIAMKRANHGDDAQSTVEDRKMKKIKIDEEEEEGGERSGFMNLDSNLLYEILKHVDAKTLAMASCVSKQWHDTAQDERLWELICTRHWANIGCGNRQLRSVVLALGGFRRLHSLYIWPLIKPQSSKSSPSTSSSSSSSSSSSVASSPTSSWGPLPPMIIPTPPKRWGKDEVNLSLSLLSIRFYEKMNNSNRGR